MGTSRVAAGFAELCVCGHPVEELNHLAGSWTERVRAVGDAVVEAVALDRSDLRHPASVGVGLRATGPCADGLADVPRRVADGADDRLVDPSGEDSLDRAKAVEVAGVLVDECFPLLLSVDSGRKPGF